VTTIPTTGTDWITGGFATVDNRFYTRGPLAAVLIRDNLGESTNISPYQAGTPPTAFWSPLAQDGNLRSDLFAQIRVDGQWQLNTDTNEGFYLIGALAETGGPDRKPAIKHDDAMILQSNFPFDTDLTGEGITIQFTGVETYKPLMKRLRMNLPLVDPDNNPIVELPGESNWVLSKPVDADSIDRQVLLVFGRKHYGQYIYNVEGYSLCKLTDIGNFKHDKTDPDSASLTFTVLPDPYMVDIDPTDPSSDELVPVLFSEWMGGAAWTGLSGAPAFPGLAPVALTTGTTTAKVYFTAAQGGGDSITYTLEKYTSSAWSSASSTTTTNSPVDGAVTLNVTGLTTGTQYAFRVTAHGANTQTAVSATSNTITTN
jgi:hypothetical protein